MPFDIGTETIITKTLAIKTAEKQAEKHFNSKIKEYSEGIKGYEKEYLELDKKVKARRSTLKKLEELTISEYSSRVKELETDIITRNKEAITLSGTIDNLDVEIKGKKVKYDKEIAETILLKNNVKKIIDLKEQELEKAQSLRANAEQEFSSLRDKLRDLDQRENAIDKEETNIKQLRLNADQYVSEKKASINKVEQKAIAKLLDVEDAEKRVIAKEKEADKTIARINEVQLILDKSNDIKEKNNEEKDRLIAWNKTIQEDLNRVETGLKANLKDKADLARRELMIKKAEAKIAKTGG